MFGIEDIFKIIKSEVTLEKKAKLGLKIFISLQGLILLGVAGIFYIVVNESNYRDIDYKFRYNTMSSLVIDSIKIQSIADHQKTTDAMLQSNISSDELQKEDIERIKGHIGIQ